MPDNDRHKEDYQTEREGEEKRSRWRGGNLRNNNEKRCGSFGEIRIDALQNVAKCTILYYEMYDTTLRKVRYYATKCTKLRYEMYETKLRKVRNFATKCKKPRRNVRKRYIRYETTLRKVRNYTTKSTKALLKVRNYIIETRYIFYIY